LTGEEKEAAMKIFFILVFILVFLTGCSDDNMQESGRDFVTTSGTFGINEKKDMELDFDEENTADIILNELQNHARIQGISDDIGHDDIEDFLWSLVIGGVNGVIEANTTGYNERDGLPRRMEVLSEDNIWYDLRIYTHNVNIRQGEQRIWYSISHIINMETGESVMYEW